MTRLRVDNVFGSTDTALATGDTALSSPALARLPVVAGGDTLAVTLYNDTAATYEIVWVTAHTASATTATILRAQESTTAAAWTSGTSWVHGPTARDVGTPIALVEVGAATPSGLLPGTLVIEKGRTPAAAILADGPIAYYKLDETTGNFLDSSGNGRDLTPGTGVVRSIAPINPIDGGFAASSSGSAPIGSWTPGTAIASLGSATWAATVECRVRIPTGAVTYFGSLASFGPGQGGGFDIGIGSTTNQGVAGNFLGGTVHGQGWPSSGFTLAPGDYHLALAKSALNNVFWWYVNGEQVAQMVVPAASNPSPTSLIVGGGDKQLSAGIAVDDVAFYDKWLTPSQVKQHYAGAVSTKFRGWWNGTSIQPLVQ